MFLLTNFLSQIPPKSCGSSVSCISLHCGPLSILAVADVKYECKMDSSWGDCIEHSLSDLSICSFHVYGILAPRVYAA